MLVLIDFNILFQFCRMHRQLCRQLSLGSALSAGRGVGDRLNTNVPNYFKKIQFPEGITKEDSYGETSLPETEQQIALNAPVAKRTAYKQARRGYAAYTGFLFFIPTTLAHVFNSYECSCTKNGTVAYFLPKWV